MTVSSSTSRNTYNGNGSTDTFAYTFKILDDDHILVQWKDSDTGVITTKTKTTHYTVSNVGSSGGGNVVFTLGNIPASTDVVILLRNLDFLQETDYTEYDSFPAETHEEALDKLDMQDQQIKEQVDRAFKFDPSIASSLSFEYNLPDPTDLGGYFLRINDDEDAFEWVSAIDLNNFTVPGTDGIMVKTGSSSSTTRTLIGTSAEITVTNGSGVSGDPTLSLPTSLTFTSKTITGGTFATNTFTTSSLQGVAYFSDASDTTKRITFALTGITTATTRTITWQDSNGTVAYIGNKLSVFAATTSAELAGIISDETGSGALVFATTPSLTTPQIITSINDTNGNELINVTATGSAVNEFTVANAATGTSPTLSVSGTDSTIDINFQTKGAGYYRFRSTASQQAQLVLYEDTDNGADALIIQGPASMSGSRTVAFPDTDLSCFTVQRVSTQTGAVATGTTVLPADDTIPQNTEGDQYLSLAITPKNTANILKIDVTVQIANSAAAGTGLAIALFQDSTASALSAKLQNSIAVSYVHTIQISHTMTAGTVSSTTFKVRAGGSAAGTTTINGSAGARIFGGIINTAMTITEYSS